MYAQGEKAQSLFVLIIVAAVAGVKSLSLKANKLLRATAYYNLGLALLEAYQNDDQMLVYRDTSILFFKNLFNLNKAMLTIDCIR